MVPCPRCGFLCDEQHRFCMRCGNSRGSALTAPPVKEKPAVRYGVPSPLVGEPQSPRVRSGNRQFVFMLPIESIPLKKFVLVPIVLVISLLLGRFSEWVVVRAWPAGIALPPSAMLRQSMFLVNLVAVAVSMVITVFVMA